MPSYFGFPPAMLAGITFDADDDKTLDSFSNDEDKESWVLPGQLK